MKIAALFPGAVAVLGAGVWRLGYVQALDGLAKRGEANLAPIPTGDRHAGQGVRALLFDHPPRPGRTAWASAFRSPTAANPDLGLADQTAQVEKGIAEQTLRRSVGRAIVAAEAPMLPRKTFYDKLARHGIRPESFRPT